MALPLEGVRVLDFTWVVAGPVATRILADHGAEVVKIERRAQPSSGDRKLGLHCDLHRNKISTSINMGHPRGLELARRLVLKSDIVMDNFSARVMRGWGMDYQSMATIKPDIICISMSGLGHSGPRSSYVSFGPTLQALSGFTYLMTHEEGEPVGWGYSYADVAGGCTGALAALIALHHRRRTGQGQFIDLSQLESLTALIGPSLLDITVNRREQRPPLYASQEAPAAPHGVYRCASLLVDDGSESTAREDDDRWVAISVRSHAEWERLSAAIGSPAWTSDPRFRTLYLRIRNREELDANLTRWTRVRSAETVMGALQRAKVAAGIVANGADICARDPQLEQRGFWAGAKHPEGFLSRVTGIPFKLSVGSGSVRTLGPEIGENNDYVLGDLLGLSRAEREELIACGAVWA